MSYIGVLRERVEIPTSFPLRVLSSAFIDSRGGQFPS